MLHDTRASREGREDQGVAAVEYGLLVAAVAAVIVVVTVVLIRG